MRSPIGFQEAAPYPYIGIVEGGPNALAVIAHAWASGVETRVTPICMPSTTSNFTASALAHLQGKRGRIFIDDDAPGHAAAERWAAQLASADIVVDGFSFTGLVMSDGRPVTDLNELLQIDSDCWEAVPRAGRVRNELFPLKGRAPLCINHLNQELLTLQALTMISHLRIIWKPTKPRKKTSISTSLPPMNRNSLMPLLPS